LGKEEGMEKQEVGVGWEGVGEEKKLIVKG